MRRPWWCLLIVLACSDVSTTTSGFRVLAIIDAGLNPHQIAFSGDGRRAYVAAAGSDRVTVIDVPSLEVRDSIPVADVPLGVAVQSDGSVAATRFGADEIVRYAEGAKQQDAHVTTGGAPSLLAGPLPDGELLVSVEQSDLLWFLDPVTFTLTRAYQVGDRPFPPAATSDGRLVFVPNYDDGTVTIIDVWNDRIVSTTPVGNHPSGGTVFPGDTDYVVAVRGEDKIKFINTASFDVVDSMVEGVGDEPFSVVLTPNGRLAFVNNTASHDISVIDVATRSVVEKLSVGEQPIVMAVHPAGESLWVSSEGSDELTVLEIPAAWRRSVEIANAGEPVEVAVMGMIHGRHPTSELWGFDALEHTIRNFNPDIVCVELPPNRFELASREFNERGVIEEGRTVVFPEYNPFMFRLAAELGFTMVPCAAWTREMNDLRRKRIEEFETSPQTRGQAEEYRRLRAAARERHVPSGDRDDPRYIHSAAHDAAVKAEYEVYDRYLNDWIGPGGWTNINVGHVTLIDQVIASNPGKRILITFGAAHKYWFLEHLSGRGDVRLLDLEPFLPAAETVDP